MADLIAIRDALAKTIRAGVKQPIFTYKTVEEIVSVPCIMVEPFKADFEGAFQRGMHTWEFYVFVLGSRAPGQGLGQELLDRMVSGTGPDSVVRILDDRPDLGLGGETQAQCYGLKGYGGSFDWAKIPHVGAILQVRVMTDPRE
ncbi:hypothetical protein GS534_24140 [Rhodococcus hoagii]|nr:hypothetical protein [Prescottella equi]MBM4613728.1 hypothetical protein [Prescottella equi]MBM4613729.1 hypothetical protein [Prescottella equi]MBM4617999.1 hypothetical protein [Prescottella equi]NKS33120.1 hypothetical protein [Prescottella equi]